VMSLEQPATASNKPLKNTKTFILMTKLPRAEERSTEKSAPLPFAGAGITLDPV